MSQRWLFVAEADETSEQIILVLPEGTDLRQIGLLFPEGGVRWYDVPAREEGSDVG